MALARCRNPKCLRVLDIPEVWDTWRMPDGRCARCHGLTEQEVRSMEIPKDIVTKLKSGVPQVEATTAKPSERKYNDLRGVKVETGVPLPGAKEETTGTYPFDKMKAPLPDGSLFSFFVPKKDPEDKRFATRIASAVYSQNKKHKNKKFVSRTVEGGVRVWRVK